MNNTITDHDGMDKIIYTRNGINHTLAVSDIRINQDDLSNEFAMQASLFAYVAQLSVFSTSDVKSLKVQLEEMEAIKDKYYRSLLSGAGSKVTEGAIASHVTADSEVMALKRQLLQAEEIADRIKAIEFAYRMRSDMLIQLGTRQRAEMQQIDAGRLKKEYPQQQNIIYDTKE